MTPFAETLAGLKENATLPVDMAAALAAMIDGDASTAETMDFLTLLATRGETPDDLAAAARILRARAVAVHAPPGAADCCGTGGDGLNTYNVSTAVAFVAAACGVPMAKHGNRSASSLSGAADVLAVLGVELDVAPDRLAAALAACNFAFLMAPRHHPSLARVAAARKALGRRTIFNLLGPLANPAGVQFQLVGVYDRRWLEPMARALQTLGSSAAWIVHSRDGLDEISIGAPTDVAVLDGNGMRLTTVDPSDFGLPVAPLDRMRGGDATVNAAALLDVLRGRPSAYRDCVLANAAALLTLTGRAADLKAGVALAAAALDGGAALDVLDRYRRIVAAP